MQNPAVVPSLVSTQRIFFFNQQQLHPRPCLKDAQSGSQADNTSTNYDKIVFHREIRNPLLKAPPF
jgi:hypothetical protein